MIDQVSDVYILTVHYIQNTYVAKAETSLINLEENIKSSGFKGRKRPIFKDVKYSLQIQHGL